MKSVLMSIQPYWVFLIIAKTMGWEIEQEKTIEVRKNYPKDDGWNRKTVIYCSKDKKSFNRIPKEYQPLMAKFLGKVVGEFICDNIERFDLPMPAYFSEVSNNIKELLEKACLSMSEAHHYIDDRDGYGWHISNLKIYDKPKELSEFKLPCSSKQCASGCNDMLVDDTISCLNKGKRKVKRPPQSWCYIEE